MVQVVASGVTDANRHEATAVVEGKAGGGRNGAGSGRVLTASDARRATTRS